MNGILICLSSALLICIGPASFREDCLVAGPTINNGAAVTAPDIQDNGTTTGTNGAGCDGCIVNWHIKVTWNHTGTAKFQGPAGTVTFPVTTGQEWFFDSTDGPVELSCDKESVLTVRPDPANPDQISTIRVACKKCQ